MASRKIICSFIFVQMLLIIINTEGTEIYLQREKEEKRLFLYTKNTGTTRFFYKAKKRKREKINNGIKRKRDYIYTPKTPRFYDNFNLSVLLIQD